MDSKVCAHQSEWWNGCSSLSVSRTKEDHGWGPFILPEQRNRGKWQDGFGYVLYTSIRVVFILNVEIITVMILTYFVVLFIDFNRLFRLPSQSWGSEA